MVAATIHGLRDRGSVYNDLLLIAEQAAEQYLAARGIEEAAAWHEYLAQFEAHDDEGPMTGLARAWIDAREAAQAAVDAETKRWARPPALFVELYK